MKRKLLLFGLMLIIIIMGNVVYAAKCPGCGSNNAKYGYYDGTYHSLRCDDCYSTYKYKHEFGSWTSSGAGTGNTHKRTCSKCGYTQSGNHSYGSWKSYDDSQHRRYCTQSGCPSYMTENHMDNNNDGYCDTCSYYMGVTTTPATAPTLENSTFTYDGNAHYINVTTEGSGGVTYYKTSTDGGSTWGSWSTKKPSLTDVGTIHVKAYVKGDSEHSDSDESAVKTLTVNAATLTGITVTNYSAQYDGDSHGITVSAPEGAVVKYGTTSGTYNLNSSPIWTDWTNGNKTVYYQVTKENYGTVTGTGTVNITKRELDVTKFNYGPLTKVYDKTTNKPTGFTVTATESSGLVAGETVSISHTNATYNNANAGTGKTISVSGLSLSETDTNYKLKSNATSYTVSGAEITKKELDVTKFTYGPLTKVYDNGTTAPTGFGATVTSASGLINGDSANITLTASYNNKNVLNANKINVSNMSISNSNYSLSSNSTSVDATITPKPLDVSKISSNVNTKVYDGTTNAPANFTLTVPTTTGKLSGDTVSANYATATYNSQYVTTANKIIVTGVALGGADASNYSLNGTTVDISATITPKVLDTSKFTYIGNTKVYDGTTTGPNNIVITVTAASGKLNADVVNASYISSAYNSKNVSSANTITISGISISGSGSSNYSLSGTSQNITGTITKKQLTVNKFTYSPTTKVYDGTITAPSGFTATVSTTSGLVNGDTVTVSFTNAQYNDANVLEANKITITGLSISGTSSGNYSLNSTTGEVAATITRAPVTISLNPTSGNVVEHEQITSTITYIGDGSYTVTSSNSNIATASAIDHTLTIVGVATGTATISIRASEGNNYQATSNTATFNVTVTDANYEVNGHYYTTLQAAIGSISTTNQTTITVLQSCTDSSAATIPNTRNTILDLQDYTITRQTSAVVNKGTLEIKGTGKITATNKDTIANLGTLNIFEGEPIIHCERTNSSCPYAIDNQGTFTILNGKITSNYRPFLSSGGNTTINGGEIKSTTNIAIRITGGNITITNGTISGFQGINFCFAPSEVEIKVIGGIINASQMGITWDGDAEAKLIIGTENGGVDTTTPVIQGGTYGIDVSSGFEFYDGIIKGGTVAINGGTEKVTDKQNGYDVVYSSEMIGNTKYETAFLSQASNYEVNGKKYETLGDAYASITSNTETVITVLKSNTDNSVVNFASGRNIILDTQTYTITKTGSTISNAGTLTLNGTGTITSSSVNTITNSGTLTINTDATNITNTEASIRAAIVNSGTLTSSKGVISGVAKAITNSGTMTISGGTVTAAGSTSTEDSYGIEMTAGSATISGSTTINATNSSNGKATGIYVAGGTLNFNNITLTAKSYGIVNAGTNTTTARVNINDGSITAERGVWSNSTTTSDDITIILDGEINATECGVGNEGNGPITIGENDGSVSTTIPNITSDKYGFYQDNSSGGSLNFYDGIIKGKTLAIVAEGTINTPNHFEVVYSESGNYKVATLDARKPFITEWTVPANTTITLPIAESSRNDYYVDWGDGTETYYTGASATFPTHTYTTAGTKTIRISGTVNTFGYYSEVTADSKYNSYFANLTAVRQLGEIGTTRYGFANCTNLTSFTGNSTENTFNRITDTSYMFYGCSGLTSLNVNDFDTSNVTLINNMFDGCSGLTSLSVNELDTSKVTNMSCMFRNCSELTQLVITNFNTSNVTNMNGMFYACRKLTEINVSNFNTANVRSMYAMFDSCTKLETLDLSNFDTSKVEIMSQMFINTTSLTNINFGDFNTHNVKEMYRMFTNCGVRELDLSSFDTSNVTNMVRMFQYMSNIDHLDLSNFNTAKVIDMTEMFSGDTALKTLVLGKDFDRFCSANMFSNTPNLTAIIAQRTTPITISGSGLGVGENTVLYAPTESSANAYRTATNYSEEFMSSDGIIRVKPILELIGDNYVVVTHGNSYTEQGVKTAGFNMTSADLSGNIAPQYLKDYGYKLEVDSTVDLSKTRKAPYTVTYTLTYKGQSVMSVVRKVKVTGTPDAPTISVVNTSGVVINSGEWSNKPIKITFSPIDDEIGYKYSFDGVNWYNYSGTFEYSTNTRETTLHAVAYNTANTTLESNEATFRIKLDTVSPSGGTMKLDANPNDGSGKIRLSVNGVSDEVSGIAKYVWEYKKTTDANYTEGKTITTSSSGSTFEFPAETGKNYVVKVAVYDVAGNKIEYLSTDSGIAIIISDDVAQMNPTIRIKDKDNIEKDNVNGNKVKPTVIIKSTSEIKTITINNTPYNITSGTTTINGQTLTQGKSGDEYSYEFKLVITSNGNYKITAVDSNDRSSTEEFSISSFKDIDVTYRVVDRENDKEVIFTANEPVKALSSVPSTYSSKIKGDSGTYSVVNRLVVTEEELEVSFIFEDKNLNESNIVTVTITKATGSDNTGRYVRAVANANDNKFAQFGTMDVDTAYRLAQEMDGKLTVINSKPTLYYGVSSGQADMFMSRARDVGSALYIMNASSINKYDGKNITNISHSSGSNSVTYGLQGVGANTEFMSAYVGSPSTNSLTSADAKYKDIINTSGISLYKGLGISNISGEGFVTRSGNNYSTSGTASVSGGTFRVTLINK